MRDQNITRLGIKKIKHISDRHQLLLIRFWTNFLNFAYNKHVNLSLLNCRMRKLYRKGLSMFKLESNFKVFSK